MSWMVFNLFSRSISSSLLQLLVKGDILSLLSVRWSLLTGLVFIKRLSWLMVWYRFVRLIILLRQWPLRLNTWLLLHKTLLFLVEVKRLLLTYFIRSIGHRMTQVTSHLISARILLVYRTLVSVHLSWHWLSKVVVKILRIYFFVIVFFYFIKIFFYFFLMNFGMCIFGI